MNVVRVSLRLTSAAIAGLFASRGGLWWVAAVLYLLTTVAPIRPRGTRLALGATILFTLVVAVIAAYLAVRGDRYLLWALLTVYGLLQSGQEKLASAATSAQQKGVGS